jgi:hypothetical protein
MNVLERDCLKSPEGASFTLPKTLSRGLYYDFSDSFEVEFSETHQAVEGMRAPWSRVKLAKLFRAVALLLGQPHATGEVEGNRQDDHEAGHDPQLDEHVLKLFRARGLFESGSEQ